MIDVSIIIPVYNAEKYIAAMTESAINQTYKNTEIILVDDGSTDASGKICDELAAGDSRISVIHKENGGLSSARNAGIEIARGEYIYFADADDILDLSLIEDNLALACSSGADIVIFGYIRRIYRKNGSFYESVVLPRFSGFFPPEKVKANLGEICYHHVSVSIKLFSRSFIEKNNVRFENISINEDDMFVIRIMSLKGVSVYFNPKAYYYYILRKGSLMNSYRSGVYESVYSIAQSYENAMKTVGADNEKNKETVNKYYIRAVNMTTGFMAEKNCPFTWSEKLNRLRKMMDEPKIKKAFSEIDPACYSGFGRVKVWLLKNGFYRSAVLLGQFKRSFIRK